MNVCMVHVEHGASAAAQDLGGARTLLATSTRCLATTLSVRAQIEALVHMTTLVR